VAGHVDFVLPKLYVWMGGYDGLYGSVYRWIKTLRAWNPAIPEDLVIRFVFQLLGTTLPEVRALADLERHIDPENLTGVKIAHGGEPFPDAFFADTIAAETRRLLASVGDPARVR